MEMTRNHFLTLLLGVSISALAILLFLIFCTRRKRSSTESDQHDVESHGFSSEAEELVTFHGGEDLTICDILDAPGEVIGKSSYGTLYKASLQRSGKVRVLRFLRPVCTLRSDAMEFSGVIETLGVVRHENLVPLLGFYGGNRGEKLMVHPFFSSGNLSDFIRSGDDESVKWINILRISIGIAEALDYLHSKMQKPIVHGNLKSKNVLLSSSFEPRVSDFGLHLLLNITSGQEILDVSAAEGYKAPELIKVKEVSKESDVYSLGVIMLELVSGKEPINKNPTGDDELYLADVMRNAVLDHKLSDLYRPEILKSNGDHMSEECVLEYFQLAMSCCSPSPSLRPNIKQVLRKLEDIKKC
ncbi:Protein kinase superfamily protein [Raphanus sativus]|uniref:Kinase-like protein TMKL1 n=1 Tax=Raphanus sativus TaxID=3726 RepID=A0A6J0KG67_RAPSA|nr:putative kinase-like protein TMKL1 [Raphanus sativus]KAJ4883307.1 Protein kinase superfamily protein [Raphanus sativus]